MSKKHKKLDEEHDENQKERWIATIIAIFMAVLAVVGAHHSILWIKDLIAPLFTDFHSVICR